MNTGRGGVEVDETEVVGSEVREEDENSLEEVRLAVEREIKDLSGLLRFRFDREKEDVRLESMPSVRDFGIC